MLEFRINEIPLGKSDLELKIKPADLDTETLRFDTLDVKIQFTKEEFSVDTKFEISGDVILTCDRSLDEFSYRLHTAYEVLFKGGIDFESEDEQMCIRPLNIAGNTISIKREVRDTLLLSIPVRKLHPRYIDEYGNETEFTHEHDKPATDDPRWDALNVLKKNIQNN